MNPADRFLAGVKADVAAARSGCPTCGSVCRVDGGVTKHYVSLRAEEHLPRLVAMVEAARKALVQIEDLPPVHERDRRSISRDALDALDRIAAGGGDG